MPELIVEAGGQVVVTVRLESTVREAVAGFAGDGLVSIEVGGVNVGARFVGRPEVLMEVLKDAECALGLMLGSPSQPERAPRRIGVATPPYREIPAG